MATTETEQAETPLLGGFLSCGICGASKEKELKASPCLHLFCQDCLREKAGEDGTFSCPRCKKSVSLPAGGVNDLPDSLWVHDVRRALESRPAAPPDSPEAIREGCEHPVENARIFCDNCDKAICEDCVQEPNPHKGHQVRLLSDAIKQKQGEVQTVISSCLVGVSNGGATLNKLDASDKSLRARRDKLIQEIEREAQILIDRIVARRERLGADVESKYNEKSRLLQEKRSETIETVAHLLHAVEKAETSCKEDNYLRLSGAKSDMIHLSQRLTHVTAEIDLDAFDLGLKFTSRGIPEDGVFRIGRVEELPVIRRVSSDSSDSRDDGLVDARPRNGVAVNGNNNGERNGEAEHSDEAVLAECQEEQCRTSDRSVMVGRAGTKQEQFNHPCGLAVSEDDVIFVADTDNKRIQVLNSGGEFVRVMPTLSKTWLGRNTEHAPVWVAIGAEGNLYVTYRRKPGVDVFQEDGAFVTSFARNVKSSRIAISPLDGHVVVASESGIRIFTSDGQAQKMFSGPAFLGGVAVSPQGDILVSDRREHCVKVYRPDGKLQRTLSGWGEKKGQCYSPRGVCVDRRGNVIVADRDNGRVQMFNSSGKFLRVLGTRADGLDRPEEVALLSDGRIVVLDSVHQCLFVITP
ncbi:PREDICTED: tripartite motif-containing protein 3-like [Branchiostoma belcheri]|uniref:RING-type E3 ubiquitin transferase n=1 Tax=Branchiostoma belcheri TaxID=7741 RepID=A0A6P4YEX7_BRABE|nr:PREDICTED: tripartite motif-containing protein 3-like [Branchiostoma belcheri]